MSKKTKWALVSLIIMTGGLLLPLLFIDRKPKGRKRQ
jgi:hypothetical protein